MCVIKASRVETYGYYPCTACPERVRWATANVFLFFYIPNSMVNKSTMKSAENKVENPVKDDFLSREQLVTDHLPHVKRIVNRIAAHLPSSAETDDLFNAGIIGLIEASLRFDPTRDNTFITYASYRIKGAVLSELRSRDFLSKSSRRKSRDLEQAYSKLRLSKGGEVNDDEVAGEMGVSLNKYYEIKKLAGLSFISLEETGFWSNGEKNNLLDYLVNGNDKDVLELTRIKEIEKSIAKAIERLSEKEKLVVSLYYWDELTMKEIGKVLSLTESRVSQIHSQAIINLRIKLKNEDVID